MKRYIGKILILFLALFVFSGCSVRNAGTDLPSREYTGEITMEGTVMPSGGAGVFGLSPCDSTVLQSETITVTKEEDGYFSGEMSYSLLCHIDTNMLLPYSYYETYWFDDNLLEIYVDGELVTYEEKDLSFTDIKTVMTCKDSDTVSGCSYPEKENKTIRIYPEDEPGRNSLLTARTGEDAAVISSGAAKQPKDTYKLIVDRYNSNFEYDLKLPIDVEQRPVKMLKFNISNGQHTVKIKFNAMNSDSICEFDVFQFIASPSDMWVSTQERKINVNIGEKTYNYDIPDDIFYFCQPK